MVFFFFFFFLTLIYSGVSFSNPCYIIQADISSMPSQHSNHVEWYADMFAQVNTAPLSIPSVDSRMLYTYTTVFSGFAAKMTATQAKKLAKMPGVIHVYEDTAKTKLMTTWSPSFIGFNYDHGFWPEVSYGDDVIIGLVDSGIWPESPSFRDRGLKPIGPRWKGECENGTDFSSTHCNNKLIGARFFVAGYEAITNRSVDGAGEFRSPRDGFGHGSHVASIAAGAEVRNASLLGAGNGTARGVAMNGRIAMYKACWHRDMCSDADVLAAIEKSVDDGVDVISLSIGVDGSKYDDNSISIATYAAVRRGIFVAAAAGNSGSLPFSVQNTAPWLITVGASTMDRTFPAEVMLGNGKIYTGYTFYSGKSKVTGQLYYIGSCFLGSLVSTKILDKIVVCENAHEDFGFQVAAKGGIGIVGLNDKYDKEIVSPMALSLPGLTIGYKESLEIIAYIKEEEKPSASLKFHGEMVVGKRRAPMVSSFSSRGPYGAALELLKPDLIAPGSEILAAWVHNRGPSGFREDTRRSWFNILSGTSMACPHVAGIAALLHKAYPNWSAAAIRSALMTTSAVVDNQFRPMVNENNLKFATPFDFGAGHVHPVAAHDPGLIYDATPMDYIDFLCSLNYTAKQIKKIVGSSRFSCSTFSGSPGDLNYPSFSVLFDDCHNFMVHKRTLTNVAELSFPETYYVNIVNHVPEEVQINVEPTNLTFHKMNEKRTFTVEFKSMVVGINSTSTVKKMEYGYLLWESDQHIVRSPISLMWTKKIKH